MWKIFSCRWIYLEIYLKFIIMDYKEKIIALLNDKELSKEQKEKLEYIFPELKESEDEKIRKALVRFHKSTIDIDGIKGADIIAWLEKQGQTFTKKDVDDAYLKGISDVKNELEKQGKQDARYRCLEELLAADDIYQMSVNDTMTNEAKEKAAKALSKLCIGKLLGFEKQGEQKPAVTDFNAKDWYVSKVDGKIHDMTYNPADKVEPKFHEGEWIVWKNKCYKVNYNGCGYELIDQNGLSTWLEYGTVDTSARLYDVAKDAKDSDVLISQYGNPLIYNGNYNSLNIGAYCGITCDDNKFKVAEEKCKWTENVDIKPATKEQRDTLEKAMADAGYTFDFEKKELKKIEDEIEIHFGAKDSELIEERYYISEGCYVEVRDGYVTIKKDEKSAAWSEEDEEMIEDLIKGCVSAEKAHHFVHTPKEIADWLKSLKDRIGG